MLEVFVFISFVCQPVCAVWCSTVCSRSHQSQSAHAVPHADIQDSCGFVFIVCAAALPTFTQFPFSTASVIL